MSDAPSQTAKLEADIRDLVRVAMGAIRLGAGMTREEIEGAALPSSTPAPLRIMYRTVGRLPEAMTSHHRFLPPHDLRLHHGGLVFCEERGGRILWAVMSSQADAPDPPVFQCGPLEHHWQNECHSLCVFLTNMLCWQLLSSMPVVARFGASLAALKEMKHDMRVVSATLKYHMAALIEEHHGVLASVLYDSERVYLGGQDEQALIEFGRRFGVALEWMKRP